MEVKLWKTNIRMGGGQNTYKINPLFKDVKEYNKYLLSLIGIFVFLLSGIISYNYTNTSYAKWSSSTESKNIIKIHIKTGKSALEFTKDNVGIGGLEEITHEIDNTLQVDEKFKTEYRYRGGNVNNYVTFNNELWRMVGIIPTEDTSDNVEYRFKIIKDESIGNFYWNSTRNNTDNSNNWLIATLNTYLNTTYYNTLSSNAKSMIGTTKYYLGGYKDSKMTSDVMWQYERKNEANKSNYYYDTNPVMQNEASKKIALMYISDYGYAASKKCTSDISEYNQDTNCKTPNNWIDKSEDTWLLSQYSSYSIYAFYISSTGNVSNFDVGVYKYAIRPTLTLSSNAKISGGVGTSSEPYQLSID